ncbi:hypothetical protein HYDPIDRAFT_164654 [Hydnomerulius pinastri MD-312]|nr:hypothetical protein HYDPIDRAFT_164654 [Hydnomerulius pinastri MD-312]
MSCPECGGEYVLDEEVCSSICTQCGTLADPAQYILASHIENPDTTNTYSGNSWLPSTSAHSSIRNKNGWNIAGQTKEARDRKNKIAMSHFINSVLSKLSSPGLSPRADAIFTQAMSKGGYRWGRKAKLTAGASIAIALREAHKSDSLRDIAFLLDDSPVSLARAFQSVVSLLDFTLSSTDPAVHLPILQAHLQSLIHPETLSTSTASQLPSNLVTVLTPLSLPTAVRTATSLSEIICHQTPPLPLTQLPTPPTACALFILALEAETRAPLPHMGDLARSLASRFGLAGGVVSSRYKVVYDLIEEWIREVPWLDQFVYKGKGRGSSARSKVPKRAIVAKGIKDVIQFQEEIWMKRMQTHQKIKLVLESEPGGFGTEDDADDNSSLDTSSFTSAGDTEGAHSTQPPKKKRKIKHGTFNEAFQLLLDPLSPSPSTSRQQAQLTSTTVGSEVSLLTHILTCPPGELVRRTAPTRLQLLATSRGGSTSEDVADEELFGEGELQGYLRTDQEIEVLQPLFQLNWGADPPDDEPPATQPKIAGAEAKRGAKRVNMGALARILNGDADVDKEFSDSEKDDYLHHFDLPSTPSRHHSPTEGVESVSDWRPISPGDEFGRYYDTMEDRYEEEY